VLEVGTRKKTHFGQNERRGDFGQDRRCNRFN